MTGRQIMLEIQMQLKGKEILRITEKIDRLERSKQQTIKEIELLRQQISIMQDICPKDEVFVLGGIIALAILALLVIVCGGLGVYLAEHGNPRANITNLAECLHFHT